MVVQTQRLSVQEFDQFILEHAERTFEYIAGEIVEVVSNPLSSMIALRIGGFIFIYLNQNDIGHLTGADGGYIVAGERYIPDVGFIAYARQPELVYSEGYVSNPPDLAVEVLSPGNEDNNLRIKIANYLLAGVLVWVVNIPKQIVEVYAPGHAVQIIDINGTLDGGDVLPGFKLAVKDIFQKA